MFLRKHGDTTVVAHTRVNECFVDHTPAFLELALLINPLFVHPFFAILGLVVVIKTEVPPRGV